MIEITKENFEAEVLKSDIPVVVDFYAEWCNPCKQMMPVVEAAAETNAGKIKFVKVNVDNSDLATKYGVRGIPAFRVFSAGEVVKTAQGSQTAGAFGKFVESI